MTFTFHFYILLSGMVVIKIILCYDIMWFYRLNPWNGHLIRCLPTAGLCIYGDRRVCKSYISFEYIKKK